MIEKATQFISWWQDIGTIKEMDSRAHVAGRIAVRVFGMLLLILVSPILVIVLVFLAFFAVI